MPPLYFASVRLEAGPRYLIRARDGAYGEVFIRRVRSMGIRDRPTSPRSPWQNAYAERLIGAIRRECLDHVVVFGERHLRHVLLSYMNYDNETRTHLSLDKDAPLSRTGSEGRAYSSPSNPGRAASPIYSDLICDRHNLATLDCATSNPSHSTSLGDSVTSSTRMRFSAHTGHRKTDSCIKAGS